MIILISPAKTLDFTHSRNATKATTSRFEQQADYLASLVNALTPNQLSALLQTNDKLTDLNFERFQKWNDPQTLKSVKQALFTYDGLAYRGLDASTFSETELLFAQRHLRILSGLYGVLRPLDQIRPHRLEMAATLVNRSGKDLYAFWRDLITQAIQTELEQLDIQETTVDKIANPQSGLPVVINLASKEYFGAINVKKLAARVITPTFKDFHKGRYAIINTWSKRARGLMARFIIQNAITDPEQIKLFDLDGYYFNDLLSQKEEWIFTRG